MVAVKHNTVHPNVYKLTNSFVCYSVPIEQAIQFCFVNRSKGLRLQYTLEG